MAEDAAARYEVVLEFINSCKINESMTLSMLRNMLKFAIEKELERGYTDTNTFETIGGMYDNYCKAGGNSFMHSLYKKYTLLEIKSTTIELD